MSDAHPNLVSSASNPPTAVARAHPHRRRWRGHIRTAGDGEGTSAPQAMARAGLPVLFLLAVLALFAGGASGQQQRQAPPVPPELRGVEAQLTGLTNDVAKTISDRFSFCVSDTQDDWNGAFNYTSDLGFLQRCLAETRGDMPQRLCTPAEAKFYFTSLYNPKGEKILFLETNINCGISAWSPGCEPGWGCSVGPIPVANDNDTIPLRATNCQVCCEGFFCPRGLACMLPCPLGSYCPRAKGNSTTGLCDPYKYQITPNSTNGCFQLQYLEIGVCDN